MSFSCKILKKKVVSKGKVGQKKFAKIFRLNIEQWMMHVEKETACRKE